VVGEPLRVVVVLDVRAPVTVEVGVPVGEALRLALVVPVLLRVAVRDAPRLLVCVAEAVELFHATTTRPPWLASPSGAT